MAIQDFDPKDIQEIVETDTVRTTILSQDATEQFEDELRNTIVIKVECMELHLVGYAILEKRDKSREAQMYIKINSELGQLQYAVSDHEDAEQVQQELFPVLINLANEAGLKLIDVRAVATESLGSLRREKGVTTNEELFEILEQESGSDDNFSEITMKPEVDQYAL